jgi:hypothetical protein
MAAEIDDDATASVRPLEHRTIVVIMRVQQASMRCHRELYRRHAQFQLRESW